MKLVIRMLALISMLYWLVNIAEAKLNIYELIIITFFIVLYGEVRVETEKIKNKGE